MIDYHIHTTFSDGKNTHDEIVDRANKLGLQEIGFSDHLCLNFPNWGIKAEDIEVIADKLQLLKQQISNIKIKFGFEVDYLEGKEIEIKTILDSLPLDYVLGSVHYINDWNFDTNPADYKSVDIDQFYTDYFEVLKKAIRSGLFDIIGHIDLAKKYAFFPSFNLDDLYHEIAKELKQNNLCFELNTSGMDKPCKEFYPSENFLRILCANKVPVALGSDTHVLNNLTRYFNEALSLLKKTGYNEIMSFTNRQRKAIKI